MKKFMLFILFLLIFISAFSYIKLYDGWEYRWENEKIWHKYKTPGVPLENKHEMLYLRYKLPNVKFENPAIYYTGIFDNSKMMVGDILIYDAFAKSFFSPKSIFKIPMDFQNKYLLIKVSSNRRDVGFFGEFLLGNEMELFSHQIFVELDKILLSIFGFFVSIISFVLYIIFLVTQKDTYIRKSIIYLGLFSFGITLFISGQTQTFKYLIDNRVLFAYFMDFGKYIAPIGLMGFFYTMFDYSTKKIIKTLVLFHMVYFSLIFIIQISKGFEINYFAKYVIYLYLVMLLDIIVMIYNLYIGFKQNDSKAYIFSGTIILVSLFTIYEILGDFRIIKWERSYIQWSIFILIISMIILILKNIKELNLELSIKNKILENWNKDLEKIVKKKTKDIRQLLDNSGEGFLSFNKNYIIGNEYSNECKNIFGKDIGGLNFLDIFWEDNNEEKIFIKRVLDDFFSEKDNFKKEVYLTFLPSEMKINNKYFKVDFKYIEYEDIIMVKLKDVTMEQRLKEKIVIEKENLKKIVSVIKNYETFVLNIREFRKLLNKIIESKIEIEDYYMEIHNYKGIFAQFYLVNLTEKLHELEEKILSNNITVNDIEIVRKTFEEEIYFIQKELGYEIEKDVLKIPKSKILELENKLKDILDENNEILNEIRKLRFKNLKELINPYMSYIKELSKRLGKSINDPIIISKDEIVVDPERYYDLTKSFINLFKNIIDHGIEIPEIRIEKGKYEKGNIIIELLRNEKEISIIIEDDGEGIDIEKLKEIAKVKGISYKNDEELLNMIFLDGFTLKSEVTKISGRGIGLSSVKKEVEKLRGKIIVESEYGKGTKFKIIIPEVI
ncbi:hypothetical protein JCM30566_07350 [Marinitoga arctica]